MDINGLFFHFKSCAQNISHVKLSDKQHTGLIAESVTHLTLKANKINVLVFSFKALIPVLMVPNAFLKIKIVHSVF